VTVTRFPPLRIATRSSPLALWQAEHVAGLLRGVLDGREVELILVSTSGDQDCIQPLASFGGQGAFTREVQRAVLDGRADIAVHSLKDLPTESAPGLTLAGVPERAPRFDVLVLPRGTSLASISALSCGARIGTGSLRRRAQLLHGRRDLVMCDIRGNVETRLRKLDDGEYDAIVLAEAGLRRLQFDDRVGLTLQPPLMNPAVGQAAIGIECRSDDRETQQALDRISCPSAKVETTAERACLRRLRAGCHAPVGVLARKAQEQVRAEGVVLSRDGRERIFARVEGEAALAEALGVELADQLLALGASALIE
jgi:hydroxymethylbilane synthase